MINLGQLLDSRDRRVQHQKQLLLAYPGCSLICLTVQLPGPVKRSRESLIIGQAGLAELLNKFGSVLRHTHVRDLETGYEAYLVVPMKARDVKRICCKIEDTHPLGRLMDIDVLDGVEPLSRADLGLPARQCLLCSNEARYCMRARTHSTEELLDKISQMVLAYCG
ncbi:MAG: citrate lyase holo-[acyl-carrier protein] synthase [Bacteroidales bacterium]|nr:citrate lyase holo-[acyl-carrier protein] synthase [Bacteroidales bacterium]